MTLLTLLDGAYGLCTNSACTDELRQDRALAFWDRGQVKEGAVSIPAFLQENLYQIRAELLAWVYDTGCARLGADATGTDVQSLFLAGDSLSMWWCSLLSEKHPKTSPHLYEALKIRALELLVEREGYSGIALVTDDTRLLTVVENFCRATGRTFAHQPANMQRTSAWSLRRLYYALPALCRAPVRLGAWLWQVRRLLPQCRDKRPELPSELRPASIASYFPNLDMQAAQLPEPRFRSRYWESLHDALAPAPGMPHRVNWLFIYTNTAQCSLAESLALRDRFRASRTDGASFHFAEEFLSTTDIFAACLRYARLAWNSLRQERTIRTLFHFSGSRMDLWPFLGEEYADSFRGWRCLERCLQRIAMTRYVQWAGVQEWTIFPQENCPWERMLTQAMHEQHSSPVYGTQHSTVRPTDFRYFDDQRMYSDPDCARFQPDALFVNGSGALRVMHEAGFGAENKGFAVGIIEALRYQYLAALPGCARNRQSADRIAESASEASAVMPVHNQRALIVLTSFFRDECIQQIRTLAKACAQGVLKGWDVRLKPHPSFPVNTFLDALWPAAYPRPAVVDTPVPRLLQEADLVWAANSTTASLEAALCGVPLVVQAAENDLDLCPLQGLEGLVMIRNSADLARALSAPRCPVVPEDFLALDPCLPRWRALLALPPYEGS